MRWLVFVVAVGCAGKVEAGPTDGGTDATELGSCEAQRDATSCDGGALYYPVDLARRCIDRSAPAGNICDTKRTSIDCLVDRETGVVLVSGTSGPLPRGYCRCSPELEEEISRFPSCR